MNRKTIAFGIATLALLIGITLPYGCYYDNEVEQYGVSNCDTTAISFSQDIVPLINQNCISCHAPGGEQESSPFTNYAQIKDYDQVILERVNGIGSIMPPSGAMSSCNIDKIQAWINAGSPNN